MVGSGSGSRRKKKPSRGIDKDKPLYSRILTPDEETVPKVLFPSFKPSLTSAAVGWAKLLLEEYHLPAVEIPEHRANKHLIVMHILPAIPGWLVFEHPQGERTTAGSLDIVPQGTRLGGYSRDEKKFLILAIDPSLVERTARELGAPIPVELITSLGIHDPQIEYIALGLKKELEAGSSSSRFYGDALAVALTAHLICKFAVRAPATSNHILILAPERLRRVVQYIKENLDEDLTLKRLADIAHLNPNYFCRAFRHSTGMPPHRYVIHCRIEQAKKLLANNPLPLVDVALNAGFQNQSHFTAVFHKVTGVTPSVYRSRISRTVG